MTTILSKTLRLAVAGGLAGVVTLAGAQTTMAASGAMSSDMLASGMKMKHKMKKTTAAPHEAADMNTSRTTGEPASAPMMKGSMGTPSTMAASSPRK